MDSRLKQDLLIEDALKSQPLTEMPRSITSSVMSRIQQKDQRPAILTWQDGLFGVVLALCMAALWFTYQNLPPLVLLKIHNEEILLYQALLLNVHWLIPTLIFGIASFLTALTMPTVLQLLSDHQKIKNRA